MMDKQELLRRLRDTVLIPTVSLQALTLLRNPDASMQKIIQCLEYDPGLTANLIRIANSSLFGGVVKVKTLQEAIVRIGFRKTLELLIGLSMAPELKKPVAGYDMPGGQLWMAAISGAVFAELIVKELRIKLPDLLFTCCILRDIGKIVLGSFLEINVGAIVDMARRQGIPFEAAERDVLGLDHGEAGAIMMTQWQMPEEFIEVARWHHRPGEYPSDKPALREMVRVVHVADIFSTITGDNAGRDGLNYRIDEDVAKAFGLNFSLTDKIIFEHEQKIRELKESGVI